MFMNLFRICGDMAHLLSFVVMFWKLHTSRSVAGISLKTQELYVIVFIARYLDLFWNFLSIYNWVMKVRRPHANPNLHLRDYSDLPLVQRVPLALILALTPTPPITRTRTRTY